MPQQTIAVVGDLHYEPDQNPEFVAARQQLTTCGLDAVFQLGDHGGYSHCGSQQSFDEGLDFLSGFERPFHPILGNHDLEGREFERDEQSVAAWCRTFGLKRPYYAVELGETLAICLSSTSFRSNPFSHHEVRLDRAQFDWLRTTLEHHQDRPTFVFSHAPILGSGLRVLQTVHLCCPNAWLNHTDQPERFIDLVEEHPQIKLWFSAHIHLGQQFADTTTHVGNCTFVHTGVIGEVSRDGLRHSRLVEFDGQGFALSTIDHASGERMLDVRHDYTHGTWKRIGPIVEPNNDAHFAPPPMPRDAHWTIGASVFAIHRGMLVEYDRASAAPIGVVCDLTDGEQVRVRDDAILVVTSHGTTTIRRGATGRFGHIFTPNPHLGKRRSA